MQSQCGIIRLVSRPKGVIMLEDQGPLWSLSRGEAKSPVPERGNPSTLRTKWSPCGINHMLSISPRKPIMIMVSFRIERVEGRGHVVGSPRSRSPQQQPTRNSPLPHFLLRFRQSATSCVENGVLSAALSFGPFIDKGSYYRRRRDSRVLRSISMSNECYS